jgi:hypothetical protein
MIKYLQSVVLAVKKQGKTIHKILAYIAIFSSQLIDILNKKHDYFEKEQQNILTFRNINRFLLPEDQLIYCTKCLLFSN